MAHHTAPLDSFFVVFGSCCYFVAYDHWGNDPVDDDYCFDIVFDVESANFDFDTSATAQIAVDCSKRNHTAFEH